MKRVVDHSGGGDSVNDESERHASVGEPMHEIGRPVDGVDNECWSRSDGRLAGDVALLADELEGGVVLAEAGEDHFFDGLVGFGYNVGGFSPNDTIELVEKYFSRLVRFRPPGGLWVGRIVGMDNLQFIFVSWEMPFGFAAMIMRPASNATDTKVSWMSWRLMWCAIMTDFLAWLGSQ